MPDKKKDAKAKIAAAKRKAAKNNANSQNPKKSVKKTGGAKGNAEQKAKAASTKKPSSGDAKNYEKRADGNWYHLKTGEKVTKVGTITFLENKKDFPKGVSGNPKGYPKGQKNRGTILKELLKLTLKRPDGTNMPNPLNQEQKAMTVEEAVMAALIKKALNGNVQAVREIQDTMYGKLKDKMEISEAPTVIRDDIPDAD